MTLLKRRCALAGCSALCDSLLCWRIQSFARPFPRFFVSDGVQFRRPKETPHNATPNAIAATTNRKVTRHTSLLRYAIDRAYCAIDESCTREVVQTVDSSLISALAVLTGAATGGTASFLGSWLVHQREVRVQWLAQDKLRRQNLYREFIEEASKCYIDALQHHKPDILLLVVLYAKTSEMRVISSPEVLAAAQRIVRRVVRHLLQAGHSVY